MKIYAYLPKNEEYEQGKNALVATSETLNFNITQTFEDEEHDFTSLRQMLALVQPGDVLLVPKILFLARLPKQEWRNLRNMTDAGLNVVSLNLTTTLRWLQTSGTAEKLASRASTDTLMETIENVISYIQNNPKFAKRKTVSGSAAGRPVNESLHHRISLMLVAGASYSEIQKALNCGRSTISRVKQTIKDYKNE
ncbi:recombinase family protein [Scandinavium manionii]|uniref:recombinase family protein n=1 Tax=Scandinavium manionii TaxID=2926520 RepID=UPI0021661DD8|nr:recombinase family protein [Scandinavium manionii]MCS2150365.1 helix-turn-helix domain-containing protein [Scandinavium manionii]MCS2166590.1 helix-turn-helix domain-containing protein [Scandinavium manionii]